VIKVSYYLHIVSPVELGPPVVYHQFSMSSFIIGGIIKTTMTSVIVLIFRDKTIMELTSNLFNKKL
jgi:hypothetical protein